MTKLAKIIIAIGSGLILIIAGVMICFKKTEPIKIPTNEEPINQETKSAGRTPAENPDSTMAAGARNNQPDQDSSIDQDLSDIGIQLKDLNEDNTSIDKGLADTSETATIK